jgi:hypothetical protein
MVARSIEPYNIVTNALVRIYEAWVIQRAVCELRVGCAISSSTGPGCDTMRRLHPPLLGRGSPPPEGRRWLWDRAGSNRECAACARPDAPGVQRNSSWPGCATSSGHSSADPVCRQNLLDKFVKESRASLAHRS